MDDTSSERDKINVDTVCKVLLKSQSHLIDLMKLYKKPASEAIVFSLADTDRSWKKEVGHGMPIGYLFKGYSLGSNCMRKVTEKMLQSCVDADIHVPCVTFDGQWYKIKDEMDDGSALSLFELQRKFWKSVTAMSKAELMTKLCDVRKTVIYQKLSNSSNNSITETEITTPSLVLYSDDKGLEYPVQTWKGRESRQQSKNIDDEVAATLEEIATETERIDITEIYDRHDDEDLVQTETSQEEHERNITVAVSCQYFLTEKDYEAIKHILVQSKRKKNPFSQEDLSLSKLKVIFQSPESIQKLTDAEIKEILQYLKIQMKNDRTISFKGNKSDKILELCKLLGISYTQNVLKGSRKPKQVTSLLELTKRKVKSLGKPFLETVYAKYKWQEIEGEWRKDLPVASEIDVEKLNIKFKPVYTPAKMECENGSFVYVTCLDGHHIRTNIRAKLCRDGTDDLNKSAWIAVANTGNTNLSIAMVEPNKDGKVLDQQSDRFVRTMFSKPVEEEMHILGYDAEAEFTRLFREWHEAEDLPGLLALERCQRALNLREWLLKGVVFGEFPPYGGHVKGFPRVTFEGLICSIEAHLYFYELCKTGSYNWRAMSTLVAENVFSEITDMESHNNGVPSGESFRRNMAVMTGLHGIRLKPDRCFCMQTARSRAYPIQDVEKRVENMGDIDSVPTEPNAGPCHSFPISKIHPRDHEFDLRNVGSSNGIQGVVKDPFCAPRGVQPVRYNYKVDESKMLWSSRMGISVDKLN